ncbi:MAG: DUF3817 domain-containing protein [Nostocoides sp.]
MTQSNQSPSATGEPGRPVDFMSQKTPPATVRKALTFFKVMAILAGLAMFVLITEMILKYGYDNSVLSWWSPVHGFIFMGFIAATVNLGFKVGWSIPRMAGMVLGSCIPFVAFVVEHNVAEEIGGLLARRPAADSLSE